MTRAIAGRASPEEDWRWCSVKSQHRDVEGELAATVPISLVHGFLSGVQDHAVARFAEISGIPTGLLRQGTARVTHEQFATLYRLLANALDDEMPGIFSRPLRSGTLKFLCLSLLDAPRLEIALHRFCQFFHLVLDDFALSYGREAGQGHLTFTSRTGPDVAPLGKMLMLKLAHGVASWLIRQKIPLTRVQFDFPQPPLAADSVYLFPGPVQFSSAEARIDFSDACLDMPIRQGKADLKTFLSRAPEDWMFVSFARQLTCHQVRHRLSVALPGAASIACVAESLHCSERTLVRRLNSEGTTFQAIKDEVRRDTAIRALTRSDVSLAEIAVSVGFDSTAAFHRAFRRWTGSTPGTYRPKR